MDWMQKLMELIRGTSSNGTPPQGQTAPNERPWDVPMTEQGTPPGFHRMPDGSLMRDSAMAGPQEAPAQPSGAPADVLARAVQLQKQKEAFAKLLPESMWNR